MFNLLKSGGVLMIPILICGLFATYIIIERLVYFASVQKRDKELRKNLEEVLVSGDFKAAQEFCTQASTPLSRSPLNLTIGSLF